MSVLIVVLRFKYHYFLVLSSRFEILRSHRLSTLKSFLRKKKKSYKRYLPSCTKDIQVVQMKDKVLDPYDMNRFCNVWSKIFFNLPIAKYSGFIRFNNLRPYLVTS